MRFGLISPLPLTWYPTVWGWLQESPARNLYSEADTEEIFSAEVAAVVAHPTVQTWGIICEGQPSGAAMLQRLTPRLGNRGVSRECILRR